MSEKVEYVLATVAVAFGSQWGIRFIQNYRSKSQVKKEEIENLRAIIDEMREEIASLRAELKEVKAESRRKDNAYQLSFKCSNRANCPVLNELGL